MSEYTYRINYEETIQAIKLNNNNLCEYKRKIDMFRMAQPRLDIKSVVSQFVTVRYKKIFKKFIGFFY